MASTAMPRSLKRRTILTTILTGLTMGAGSTGDQQPAVGLGQLLIVNRRETAVTAHVTVEKATDQVYDQSHQLDPRTGNVVDSVQLTEAWMGDQVNYEVTVIVSPDTLETTYTTTDAEQFVDNWGTNDCYDLVFTINTQDISTALGAMNSCPQQTTKTA